MDDQAVFKRNDLMGLKPALHPFDISMTKDAQKDNQKDKNVSFGSSIKHPEYTRYSEWNNKPSHAKWNNEYQAPVQPAYVPPQGYVPQFSTASLPASSKNNSKDGLSEI